MAPKNNSKPRTTKIFWTRDEETLIGEKGAEFRLADPSLSKKEIATKAQEVLPVHRRRPVHGTTVSLVAKLTEKAIAVKEKTEAVPPPLPPIPVPTQATRIEELAEVIGDAFAELFSTALKMSLERTKTYVTSPVPPEVVKRQPKVLIVGLLPQQRNLIASEFSQYFDLRFWKDESPHTLKSLTKTSDVVIIMTDWVAHGHVATVKAAGGQDKIRLMSGTMTTLREYLEGNVQS